MAIPYVDKIGVYGFKFRCILHDRLDETGEVVSDCGLNNCKKYLNPMGQEVGIFNVLATDNDTSDTLFTCEGEFDTIALTQHADVPVIGFPGANAWKDWWHVHLLGFERVMHWAHGDKPGQELGKKVRENCRNAEVIELPAKKDVANLMLSWGPEKVLKLSEEEE